MPTPCWLKHLCSIRAWISVSVCLSVCLSVYFWLIPWGMKASCITQGILASFLLSLSHRWLWTTRFQSNKGSTPYSQNYGFSRSQVWLWELDHKESWALKNWCYWTVVLEKTLESPLESKETQPVHPKGNQSWIFIGRTDAEAPVVSPPDAKNWLTGKDPDAEKDWLQKEKGETEDEMVGWHHWLYGHAFEQALGDGEG